MSKLMHVPWNPGMSSSRVMLYFRALGLDKIFRERRAKNFKFLR